MRPLALVSVAFEAEIPLLQLQASSTASFVTADLVDEVVVIDNTARGMPAGLRADLRDRYGPLCGRLRIVRPAEVCPIPGTVGWRSQQVLKLAVSRLLRSERYLVLDAKNHFVAPLRPDFVEAPDGRVRATAHSFESHRLRPDLERVLTYLDLDPARYVSRFPSTVTPFVLDVATVRAMIADLERRSGRSFAQEFVRRDLTEFFLYSGWVAARGQGLDGHFDFRQPSCPVVWPRAATREGVTAAVAEAEHRGTPLFAVHRRALAQLDPAGRAALAQFWCRRGHFRSIDDAEAFVEAFRRGYRRKQRAQQLRDLPVKLRSIPRRIRRDGVTSVLGALSR